MQFARLVDGRQLTMEDTRQLAFNNYDNLNL